MTHQSFGLVRRAIEINYHAHQMGCSINIIAVGGEEAAAAEGPFINSNQL
jgi:hypothetical protein